MSTPEIPQEIINHIISQLDVFGRDIAPLLLVSRSFYFPAREAIFQNTNILFHAEADVVGSNKQVLLLLEVLYGSKARASEGGRGNDLTTSGREILAIIRSITITFTLIGDGRWRKLGQLAPHMSLFQDLLRTLSTCARLHTLTLTSPPAGPLVWGDIFDLLSLQKPVLRTLIAFRCQGGSPTPTLRTLRLYGLHRIPHLLITGTATDAITRLEIASCDAWHNRTELRYPFNTQGDEGIDFEEDWHVQIPSFDIPFSPFRHLETFEINNPTNLCRRDSGYDIIERVASTYHIFDRVDPDAELFRRLAELNFPFLKILKCGKGGVFWPFADYVALWTIINLAPCLTHLSLGNRNLDVGIKQYDPYPHLSSAVKPFIASKSLTSLTIEIVIDDRSGYRSSPKAGLRGAHTMLSLSFRNVAFPLLDTFTIYISVNFKTFAPKSTQFIPLHCWQHSPNAPEARTRPFPITPSDSLSQVLEPRKFGDILGAVCEELPKFREVLRSLPRLRRVAVVASIDVNGVACDDEHLVLTSNALLQHSCLGPSCQQMTRGITDLTEALTGMSNANGSSVDVDVQIWSYLRGQISVQEDDSGEGQQQ